MTTNHRIIVTIEVGDNRRLLVEADPNPLARGKFRPGDRVTWHFTGLRGQQLPWVVFHQQEAGADDDPRGPFETLAVSKRRIVGSGDSGHADPPLFYEVLIIDPTSRSLINTQWKNPGRLNFGGLELPTKRPSQQ